MRSGYLSEFGMAILAILSILLLLVDFTVPLEPGWRQLIYSADLIICFIFALDFTFARVFQPQKRRLLAFQH